MPWDPKEQILLSGSDGRSDKSLQPLTVKLIPPSMCLMISSKMEVPVKRGRQKVRYWTVFMVGKGEQPWKAIFKRKTPGPRIRPKPNILTVSDDKFYKGQKNRRKMRISFQRLHFDKGKFCTDSHPFKLHTFARDYRDPNGALFFRKTPTPFAQQRQIFYLQVVDWEWPPREQCTLYSGWLGWAGQKPNPRLRIQRKI